jgi:PEP-CTERM motif
MSFKSLSIVAAAALALCAGAAHAQVSGIANGSFEEAANSAGEFANGWQGGNSSLPTRSSDFAHSGLYSAKLAIPDPGFGGSNLFANSIDHGGLMAIDPLNWGTAPTLTFWIKGNSSETGNLNYALRYLNAAGGIISAGAGAVTLWTGNFNRDWTQISRAGVVIPVNATAVFLEMTLATGPTGNTQCGVDNITGLPVFCNLGQAAVYLDDVSLTLANPVAAVPEPETHAMMLAGLGVVGFIARRRRRTV